MRRPIESAKDALIYAAAEGDGPLANTIYDVPRAAVLRLYPSPLPAEWPPKPPPLATGWLSEAAAWLGEGLGQEDELVAMIGGDVEFTLGAGDAPAFFDQLRASEVMTSLFVAGDLKARIRGVNLCFGRGANVALAAGGPTTSDAELIELFERLREIARRLAPELAYAFVSIEDNFRAFSHVDHWPPWWDPDLANIPHWLTLTYVCDELCFEVFPYQILSPGHLERLERQLADARPLADGRVELSLGDPYAWLPASPLRDGAVASAREVLAPCLGGEDAVDAVFRERLRRNEGA